jgi:hypothetical protein
LANRDSDDEELTMAIADLRSQATRRAGPQLLDHLRNFELDLKFSAGIWFFSPPFSRFHTKYQPDLSIEQRLEIAATLADAGLRGLEAHYPNEINEDNVDLWKRFTADTGIKLIPASRDRAHEKGPGAQPGARHRLRRRVAGHRRLREPDGDRLRGHAGSFRGRAGRGDGRRAGRADRV